MFEDESLIAIGKDELEKWKVIGRKIRRHTYADLGTEFAGTGRCPSIGTLSTGFSLHTSVVFMAFV